MPVPAVATIKTERSSRASDEEAAKSVSTAFASAPAEESPRELLPEDVPDELPGGVEASAATVRHGFDVLSSP